ncbi:MAG: hypothetical protein LUD47_01125 [Clostridia bacterium]|nr:hypothetical protein [Clostridia bacterium]
MKKSSAFLIVIVLIVSVVVISFFGKSIAVGQFEVYMTDVWITNEKDANNTIYVDYDDVFGFGSVTLDYDYLPVDADYPNKVKYSLTNNTYTDENGEEQIVAEIRGASEVLFHTRGAVVAYIRTTDGSGKSDSVKIVCV